MSGIDKAKEMADKLRQSTETKKKEEEKDMAELKNELATLNDDPELVNMYKNSADVGADNLSGELPLLKVFSAGRSVAELKDGKEPTNGWFFYKPTLQQFETVTCHVLTISHGFTAEGMVDKKTGKSVRKFNQVMGGVIEDGQSMLPFVMYFTGMKLSRLWEFGKEARKYTKLKPVPIPMFALTVKMSTEQVMSDYGKVWVVNFEVIKKDDVPIVIKDQTMFSYLKEKVTAIEDTIESLIATKSVEEPVVDAEPIE